MVFLGTMPCTSIIVGRRVDIETPGISRVDPLPFTCHAIEGQASATPAARAVFRWLVLACHRPGMGSGSSCAVTAQISLSLSLSVCPFALPLSGHAWSKSKHTSRAGNSILHATTQLDNI